MKYDEATKNKRFIKRYVETSLGKKKDKQKTKVRTYFGDEKKVTE